MHFRHKSLLTNIENYNHEYSLCKKFRLVTHVNRVSFLTLTINELKDKNLWITYDDKLFSNVEKFLCKLFEVYRMQNLYSCL